MLNKNQLKSKPGPRQAGLPKDNPLFPGSLDPSPKIKGLSNAISGSKPLAMEPQNLTITTTTTTQVTTANIAFKSSASPLMTRGSNSNSNPVITKPQITPNSSNKSLLGNVNNPNPPNSAEGLTSANLLTLKKPQFPQPNAQSRSMGGTPDTFKQRRRYKDLELPNHEPTKFSFKKNGLVKAYAVNTNQGIVRNYNEDRVSIILNIMKPVDRQDEFWPRCSFFGVYDGHGGVACADFLRDHLHQFVISSPSFPWNPKQALESGFQAAEAEFLARAYKISEEGQVELVEKAGSCAIVILIVGDMCFIANVGDSRAVMSGELGDKIYGLSRDHKPMDEIEYQRITEAGGKIYQTKIQAYCNASGGGVGTVPDNGFLVGPYRVLPGRLSVTRTFGDIEAKMTELGGNPNVVVAKPDIRFFQITEEHDFVIVASDGIYDKLSNQEVIETVWSTANENKGDNIHQSCANAVENIMKTAISKRTVDNITVVMIAFSSFKYALFPKRPDLIGNNSLDNINEYRNLHEIHRINNSFDYSSMGNDQVQINFITKPILKENEAKTPVQHSSKLPVNQVKKKTIISNPPVAVQKQDKSQEKKPSTGNNSGHNHPTASGLPLGKPVAGNTINLGGQRPSAKKNENSLYTYRGVGKPSDKKK